MKTKSIAPCGLICELCYGFQREKNKCDGCNSNGTISSYCLKCTIKNCTEKKDPQELCYKCSKYPCRRLKDLEKRYTSRYGESLMHNFQQISEIGIRRFVKEQIEHWKCPECGQLLCVHKELCAYCGAVNSKFPDSRRKKRKKYKGED